MDTLLNSWAEVSLEEVFGNREVREAVLEEAIVGMVDREIGHRQQYQVSATSSTSVLNTPPTATSLTRCLVY